MHKLLSIFSVLTLLLLNACSNLTNYNTPDNIIQHNLILEEKDSSLSISLKNKNNFNTKKFSDDDKKKHIESVQMTVIDSKNNSQSKIISNGEQIINFSSIAPGNAKIKSQVNYTDKSSGNEQLFDNILLKKGKNLLQLSLKYNSDINCKDSCLDVEIDFIEEETPVNIIDAISINKNNTITNNSAENIITTTSNNTDNTQEQITFDNAILAENVNMINSTKLKDNIYILSKDIKNKNEFIITKIIDNKKESISFEFENNHSFIINNEIPIVSDESTNTLAFLTAFRGENYFLNIFDLKTNKIRNTFKINTSNINIKGAKMINLNGSFYIVFDNKVVIANTSGIVVSEKHLKIKDTRARVESISTDGGTVYALFKKLEYNSTDSFVGINSDGSSALLNGSYDLYDYKFIGDKKITLYQSNNQIQYYFYIDNPRYIRRDYSGIIDKSDNNKLLSTDISHRNFSVIYQKNNGYYMSIFDLDENNFMKNKEIKLPGDYHDPKVFIDRDSGTIKILYKHSNKVFISLFDKEGNKL